MAHWGSEACIRPHGATIGDGLLKSFLMTLLLDNPFTLHVQVRFAAHGVPVNFPSLSPTLRA